MRVLFALLGVLAVLGAGCSDDLPSAEMPSTQPRDAEPSEGIAPAEPADEPSHAEPQEPTAPEEPSREEPAEAPIRAVWVHLFDDTLKSAASIERMVAEVEAAGANTLIVQVARRHDAYYASKVLPATADPQLEDGLDVLETLLGFTASTDLQVHAWMSVAPTWHASYDELDPPAGWLPLEHGRQAPVAERWVTRTIDGEWTEYLDPALPQVTAHVVGVVEELLEGYAIDGVHLDYVRYEAADRGYHPQALARFAAETGQSGVPATDDEVWSDWRREQTRALIAEVRAAVDASGTDATLSAPVITWGAPAEGPTLEGTRAYHDALQDWGGWARDGIVDVLYPMNYFRAHDPEQAAWFEQWSEYQRLLAAETDTRIAAGVGGWLNQPEAVVEQVRMAMTSTGDVAVYSYQQPADGDRGLLFDRLADSRWGVEPVE